MDDLLREFLTETSESLDVVDILPIQLQNLAKKLPADERVALMQGDSSSLACPDASYDQVLLFFVFGAVTALVVGANVVIAHRLRPPFRARSPEQQQLESLEQAQLKESQLKHTDG